MFRVTVHPESKVETHYFGASSLVIGSGAAAEIRISDEKLKAKHVEIVRKNQHFYVLNLANDPFLTLNEKPFKKSLLQPNDLLHIGSMTVRFDGEQPTPDTTQNFIEDYTEAIFSDTPIYQKGVGFIEVSRFSKKWKIASGVLGVLFVFLLLGWGSYYRILHQSEKETIFAAKGVADVAMALSYAQITHLKPQNQNWSDPDFIKSNLASILAQEYPSFATIDNQGQFRSCPYILRIYTSSHLSQFLVIAQPEPGFLQWLVQKEAIIVDSNGMELRHISDIKSLNRLLLNANTLDGAKAQEISNLVKQGKIIPLATLGCKKGFAPPKALASLRPEAANLIYNAPRYYLFSETLLKNTVQRTYQEENLKAQEISSLVRQGKINTLATLGRKGVAPPKVLSVLRPQAYHAPVQPTLQRLEESSLQQLQAGLAHFPHIVLYSAQGIQKAIEAQKALKDLFPTAKFMVGYLSFNSRGVIASSHLLMDEIVPSGTGLSEIASLSKVVKYSESSLLSQLRQLCMERQLALKKISDEIQILFLQNNEKEIKEIELQLDALLKKYALVNAEHRQKMEKKLTELRQENSTLPQEQFELLLKQSGIQE